MAKTFLLINRFIKKNEIMYLLKFIVVGAAVGLGINYLTKKNENGRSIVEDFVDDAPQWFDQAKKMAEDAVDMINKTVKSRTNF